MNVAGTRAAGPGSPACLSPTIQAGQSRAGVLLYLIPALRGGSCWGAQHGVGSSTLGMKLWWPHISRPLLPLQHHSGSEHSRTRWHGCLLALMGMSLVW